jgi:hypothetical protein
LDGLGGEAAVALADDEAPAGLQDPAHLLEHLERLVEVINAHDARDNVEGAVGEREFGVLVEVLGDVLGQLLVLRELKLIHPEPYDFTHSRWEILCPRIAKKSAKIIRSHRHSSIAFSMDAGPLGLHQREKKGRGTLG